MHIIILQSKKKCGQGRCPSFEVFIFGSSIYFFSDIISQSLNFVSSALSLWCKKILWHKNGNKDGFLWIFLDYWFLYFNHPWGLLSRLLPCLRAHTDLLLLWSRDENNSFCPLIFEDNYITTLSTFPFE